MSRSKARGVAFVPRLALLAVLAGLVPVAVRADAVATTIHEIQSHTYPSGGSIHAGRQVVVTGTVTATLAHGFVIAEAPGPWNAIFVYTMAHGPDVGDEVEVTGYVWEYWGMTEIDLVSDYAVLSTGNPVAATLVGVGEASQEQYESVLLEVRDVAVADLLAFGEWTVSDGTDLLLCDQLNDYAYFPEVGDQLASVTGVLFYTYGDFKLEPRATRDFAGDPIPHHALQGHVVTMNDDRDVLVNGYVEIRGDEIVAIHETRPRGLPIVAVGGLIFPGLINAHDHPAYDVLGPIPFGRTFTERYEWQAEPVYAEFSDQRHDILDFGGPDAAWLDVVKLAEVRSLVAGTTSIQGINCNGDYNADFAHQGVIINNVERFPARVLSSTFPLGSSPDYWEDRRAEYWERFVIHLSEGTSQAALDELYTVVFLGMLDERVTIVHGVPYGPTEWALIGQAGASLVWSPVSNLTLYGATADVAGALAAGVNVALAPDWTESGSLNLLDEMRAADAHDDAEWGDALSPQQLVEMVTRNAAHAVGADDLIGRIAPGYRANLVVVPGSPQQPYDALLRARPATVKLTVVDGRPRYGNPELMARFPFVENPETVTLGGDEKWLAIQVDNHGIPDDDTPFLEILARLEEAYDASDPKVCDFVGLE